jgi:rare lipoprotein A
MRYFRRKPRKSARHRLTVLGVVAWSLHAPVMAKTQPAQALQAQDEIRQDPAHAASAAHAHHAHKSKKAFRQVGRASWYGDGNTRGMRTASGEPLDPQALTGAHPTLPFGTRVRVTNLRNGRSTRIRINDRGPFTGGRVIDVSYAAACELGMMGRGIAQVRIDVLPAEKPSAAVSPSSSPEEAAGGVP